jgi:hypothetical protein
MNQELVKYRVYDKRKKYHHSYLLKDEAINCAKYVSGSVKVVEDDGEKEIFNSKKPAK